MYKAYFLTSIFIFWAYSMGAVATHKANSLVHNAMHIQITANSLFHAHGDDQLHA